MGIEHAVPDRVQAALGVIKNKYDVVASVQLRDAHMHKIGSRADLGVTKSTVAHLGGNFFESYVDDNLITHIIAEDADDTELVLVEGFTITAAGLFTFHTQFATLAGWTGVELDQPLARCRRIKNLGATELVGNVYVYRGGNTTEGVPDVTAEIHAQIHAGDQRTEKCADTVQDTDFLLITQMETAILKKTSAVVDFGFEVREIGSVFIRKRTIPASSTGNDFSPLDLDPVIIVPRNSDFRMVAQSSTSATEVFAHITGYFAGIQ